MNTYFFKKRQAIQFLFLLLGTGNIFGQTLLSNFTDYDQVGQSWSSYSLGSNEAGNGITIASHGCYLVCATMLLKYSGINVTPLEVNNWLATTGDNYFSQQKVVAYPGCTFSADGSSSSFNAAMLKYSLDNGNPIIVNVTNHFMIIKGYNNSGTQMSDFIVSNPALSYDTNLSYYNGNTTLPLGTYTNILKYYYYKNFPNTLSFNQSLPIYGGTKSSPRLLDLYWAANQVINPSSYTISNFKIKCPDGYEIAIPNSNINNTPQRTIDGKLWKHFSVDLNGYSNNIHIPSNGYYCDVDFDVLTGPGLTTIDHFSGAKQLYFLNPDDLTDIGTLNDNWYDEYVKRGVKNGLFRGLAPGTPTQPVSFNPTQNLTRAQAATVIVNTAIRLGMFNIDTSGMQFQDVSPSNPYFKWIQTLRNQGIASPNMNFNPDATIDLGGFCKWINMAFGITASDLDIAYHIGTQPRIIFQYPGDLALEEAINLLYRLPDTFESELFPGFIYTLPINNAYDFSSSSTLMNSNKYVQGTNPVSRALMARIIALVFNWKKQSAPFMQGKSASDNSTVSLGNFVALGEKYDNLLTPVGNNPTLISQQTYSVTSGGSIVIQYPSNYDSSGNPQFFYWSMQKNGAILTSNNVNHSSVTFTAPTTSTITQWKLYTYTANNKGKARETYITINVGTGTGTAGAPPLQQANTLTLYAPTSTTMNASWTRGNGQNCLVTCYEVGANTQDVPDGGVLYDGNTDFNYAPAIFNGSDTKVVYTGTGTSCHITGLNPDTQYRVAVFEYNGNTPSTVIYNLNNPPVQNILTLDDDNQSVIAGFNWDMSIDMQVGQPYPFINNSENETGVNWTISPDGIISDQSALGSTNITFLASGQHTLTLTAYNSLTGDTDTNTQSFYVYSGNELLPDLNPTNLNFTGVLIGGQDLQINCNVANNSTGMSCTANILFVLSTDQVIDDADHFLGQESYVVNAGETISISHVATNIYNSFSGQYFILAKADYWSGFPNGYVQESNEDNNIISMPITVQAALPDFVALSLTATPNSIVSGKAFSVSGTFRNIGLGNSQGNNMQCDFYLSTDNLLSVDDVKTLGGIWINDNSILYGNSPIVPGSSANVKLPFETPDGNYYLICAIDFSFYGPNIGNNSSLEINENNNWIALPITVSNPDQPTINASGLSITNIANNSMRLNWTRGNGNACIVLACGSSNLPNKPVDGYNYTGNPDFSSANGINGYYLNNLGISTGFYSDVKVVYDGIGSYVDVNGLEPDETYSFIVLEYNGTGTGRDYLQFSGLKGVSAHTQGQDNLTSFKRIFGSTTSNANTSSYSPCTVKFFDQANGIIFRNDNGVGKTNDGGNTWFFNNNDVIEKNKDAYLINSYWLDNGTGWLGFDNGNLLKTVDYGNTWVEKLFDRNISDVYFVNSSIGFVALRGLTNTSSDEGAIYKSIDGGNTWNPVGFFPRPISSIFFLNDQLGWATTYSAETATNKIILKTTDGGQTWSQYVVNTPDQPSSLTDIIFVDENNGFAMTIFGWLLKTTNGGVSWSMNNIFGLSENISSHSKIDFFNPQVGFINLQNRKIAKTIDGGNSWTVSNIQDDFLTGFVAEINAYNENTLYVGGVSGLLKSTTAGSVNSISIGQVSSSYCNNNSVYLPYNITGVFGADNNFEIQLSDSSGSFSLPIVLSVFNNLGNGNVTASLGTNILPGNNYRIRLVSSSPPMISNETNVFSITNATEVSVLLNVSNTSICSGQQVTYIAIPTNGGSNPAYSWKRNGQTVGENSSQYDVSDIQNNDIVLVEMTSNALCVSNIPAISQPVSVNVTEIEPPFIQAIYNILAASVDIGIQWIRNGQLIEGANSQFYEATQPGIYQFTVTINGCSVISEIYQLDTLNTNYNTFENGLLKIYPNPCKDILNIESNSAELLYVQMLDMQGRIVKQQNMLGSYWQLYISDLPQAVYILEIKTTLGKQKMKVVKE